MSSFSVKSLGNLDKAEVIYYKEWTEQGLSSELISLSLSSISSVYPHGRYASEDVRLILPCPSVLFFHHHFFSRYNASLYIPFFWVDDYFITGAVASAANVTYAQLGSLYTIPQQLAHTRFMSSKSFYTIMFGHFVSRGFSWGQQKMCSIFFLISAGLNE